MRISVEKALDAGAVAAFHALYAAAFEPMRTRAAARHLLSAEEFGSELADGRIDKYVVWDDEDRPVALGALATDLAAVPWISPDYYAARYPDAYARGAVYYLGYILVHPERAGRGAFVMIMDKAERRCAEDRAVCGYDVCAYNDARTIGRRGAGLGAARGAVVETVDVQTYYTARFDRSPDASTAADPQLVTAASRPDLVEAVPRLLGSRWPAFMLAGHPGHGVDLLALVMRHLHHQVLLVGAGDELLGAGLSVPIDWDGSVAGLPAGWDAAVAAGARRQAGDTAPTAVCALSITTAAATKGTDYPGRLLAGLKQAAAAAGAPTLVAPVRPVLKSRYPLIPMERYRTWRGPDGRTFDPWLRRHLDAGGTQLGVSAASMTVTGTVAEWEGWLGVPLPDSGAYVINGGLAPLIVDHPADSGVYQEPNVWFMHRTET